MRTPKGWTGPEEWETEPVEGSFRSHQVPIPVDAEHTEHLDALVNWLQSYRPEELFDANGTVLDDIKELAPKGNQRMAANPITNGGIDPKPLTLPDWKNYAINIKVPGQEDAQDMTEFGGYVRDIITANPTHFRAFSTDELKSNRLNRVFEVTNRQWLETVNEPEDEFQAASDE